MKKLLASLLVLTLVVSCAATPKKVQKAQRFQTEGYKEWVKNKRPGTENYTRSTLSLEEIRKRRPDPMTPEQREQRKSVSKEEQALESMS